VIYFIEIFPRRFLKLFYEIPQHLLFFNYLWNLSTSDPRASLGAGAPHHAQRLQLRRPKRLQQRALHAALQRFVAVVLQRAATVPRTSVKGPWDPNGGGMVQECSRAFSQEAAVILGF
jgi:hypothetical protein